MVLVLSVNHHAELKDEPGKEADLGEAVLEEGILFVHPDIGEGGEGFGDEAAEECVLCRFILRV